MQEEFKANQLSLGEEEEEDLQEDFEMQQKPKRTITEGYSQDLLYLNSGTNDLLPQQAIKKAKRKISKKKTKKNEKEFFFQNFQRVREANTAFFEIFQDSILTASRSAVKK